MPDPEKRTVSATEASALFNANPYITYWMLYQKFKCGLTIERPGDERMSWGKKMQPLIIEQVSQDKKLEIMPNVRDHYFRRSRLGATRDATIIDPQRGAGALEIKCVFDYSVWMTKWQGGSFVPREYEIQLQTQMLVGDGEENPESYSWGIIAVWVCATMFYFERRPIADLWVALNDSSSDFFRRVADGDAPDPFGSSIELPLIQRIYAPVKDKVLDLSDDPAHVKTATQVSDYKKFDEDWRFNERAAAGLKAQLLALAKDAETVLLPMGINYRIKRSGRGRIIVPYIPERLSPPPAAPELTEGII
jgi:YqaJ-like viral recombinase domain